MKNFIDKEKNYIYRSLYVFTFSVLISIPVFHIEAALSCSITTGAACTGTALLRMSAATNAHAELPSISTAIYDNNVVCCSGVVGLGNSCAASNKQIFARLSGTTGTNAHVEKNDQVNLNYNNENACLSSKVGDTITIGYQSNNCDGYDTTLFSMEKTPTNSMVGIPSAYNNKVCAKIFSPSLTFDINTNSIPLGTITSSTTGSGSNTIQISTNAPSGFVLTYNGTTLTSGSNTIAAYGSKSSSSTGTAGFGLNLVDNSTPDIGANVVQNSGTCASPSADYATADKYSYFASSTTTMVNQTTAADCTYTVSYVANISSITNPGSYSTPITYVVSGTF